MAARGQINAQKFRATTASLAAPIGGWNARDALGDMPELDAVGLTNWYPMPSDVMIRKGYTRFSTGLPSYVQSLFVYSSPTGEKLIAASGTAFYDISAGGAVGAAVVTGLTNAKWEYVNISTAGGNFMYCVNGVDKPRLFNGTTWVAVDSGSSTAITGVTTTKLCHVNLFKNRLWFVEKDSLRVWYLPVNSIGGAAQQFDFMSVARMGGYLMAMGTWTLDAGYGADDYAVFITSNGEVIVYRGTDPSSSATWALTGVWQLGATFTRRCFMKFSGDLLLLTFDGLVPLSDALSSTRTNAKVAVTDKIYSAISAATQNYSMNFGWDLFYYAKVNMLVINIPVADGSTQQQFVMNTITKSWANFTDWEANCWALYNDEPYFGGNTFVGRAWNGFSDNSTNINCNAKQAFNYFKSRGRQKRFLMARPILLTNGSPTINIGVNVDFDDSDVTGTLTYSASPYGTWDVSLWDAVLWGGDLNVVKDWQGLTGLGFCGAIRLKAATQGIETHWASTDITMEVGAVI